MLCAAAMLAGLLPSSPARAQSFTWGGGTTFTTDYGTATNWSNPGTAPPVFPTQSAIFAGTGSSAVTIGAGPMQPDSWTFTSDARAYVISGNPVAFSLSGPTGGVINNGNLGQRIEISANITDGIGGAIGVQQLGNSTLVLSGANGYSGGTLISAGTVQVTNANSLGSGTVTLNGGSLQMQSSTVVNVAFSNNFAVNAAGGTIDANGAQVNLQGVIADGTGAGVLRLIDSTGSTAANVQLSGVNTYSGGTLVMGTTVVVSNNSSVGSGAVTIGDNGLFQADGLSNLTFTNNFKTTGTAPGAAIDSNGTTLTIAGDISGAGKLTVLDSFGGGAAAR
jgi:autotransporter-associated beta strand protein